MKMTYPLQAQGGKLLTTGSYEQTVRQLILSAIQTYKTERVWRNEYGISDRTFDPAQQLQPIISEVREAIAYAMGDRFDEVTIAVSGTFTDDGILSLSVGYTLLGSSGEVTV
jgi:Baseplate wedge protein gp25